MKAKLFTSAEMVAAVLVMALTAGYVGYKVGGAEMKALWRYSDAKRFARERNHHQRNRVETNLRVLQYLADGNLAEARNELEGQLDNAVVCIFGYANHYHPEGRDRYDLEVVRAARDYRSHHPWASPRRSLEARQQAEAVQKAFKWAD